MSSILSRSWHPYIIVVCEDYLIAAPIFAGLALQVSPYVIRSSVDDGANFVNCALVANYTVLKVIYMLAVDYLPDKTSI